MDEEVRALGRSQSARTTALEHDPAAAPTVRNVLRHVT